MSLLFEIHGEECEIVRRLNRFVVEIEVGGRLQKAHLNNTGRLKEYLIKEKKAYCIAKKDGKAPYRLFAIEDLEKAALIDTQFQMRAFERALEFDLIPWLKCKKFKRNQRIGDSLIDYRFFCQETMYMEVKSAALRVGNYAMYPDCPSIRGRRHISQLIAAAENYKTYILFIAAVPGVRAFKPNEKADPIIAELLRNATACGVEIRAINLVYDPDTHSVLLIDPDMPVVVV